MTRSPNASSVICDAYHDSRAILHNNLQLSCRAIHRLLSLRLSVLPAPYSACRNILQDRMLLKQCQDRLIAPLISSSSRRLPLCFASKVLTTFTYTFSFFYSSTGIFMQPSFGDHPNEFPYLTLLEIIYAHPKLLTFILLNIADTSHNKLLDDDPYLAVPETLLTTLFPTKLPTT